MVTRLVDDWGHRPLLVAYDAALVGTGGGVLGQRLHERLNTDLVVSAPAPEVARMLAMLGFLAWGDPAWHQRVGTAATATRVAVQRGIPLVVWGTRAGLDLSADRGIGVLPEVTRLHHLAEDGRGHDWTAFLGQHGLTAADLSVVRHPSRADIAAAGVRAISLPGLVPWCPPRSGIADATMDAADAWMDLVRTGSAGLEGRLSDAIRAGRIDRGDQMVLQVRSNNVAVAQQTQHGQRHRKGFRRCFHRISPRKSTPPTCPKTSRPCPGKEACSVITGCSSY